MLMSVMERRLQLLLDQERFAKVEAEARASGRSVAAIIREAIAATLRPLARASASTLAKRSWSSSSWRRRSMTDMSIHYHV